jgi:hypothetical protein
MSEVPIKHFWATPTMSLDLSPLTNRIAVLQAEVTTLTRERDEARKDAISAWAEYAGEKETSAQCLSYLRQSEDMVDTLTRERDEARRDAERLADVIRAERDALRVACADAATIASQIIRRNQGGYVRDRDDTKRIVAALTAALSEAT